MPLRFDELPTGTVAAGDLPVAQAADAWNLPFTLGFAELLQSIEWTTPTFNAADFTGSASMTWTVAAGDVALFKYLVLGKLMFVQFFLQQTTIVVPLSYALQIAVPGGKVPTVGMRGALPYIDDNGTLVTTGYCDVTPGGLIRCFKNTALASWTASTNLTDIQGFIWFQIN